MKAATRCISLQLIHQRMCQLLLLTALLLTIPMLSGCSRRYHEFPVYSAFDLKDYPNNGVGRFKTTYLVKQIEEHYRGVNPGPIGVATFVNLDDLYTTSTFGRVYAEQVMSELSMQGFDVVELRHSDALHFLATDGEFALSRDVAVVRRERDLGGIVVGTYAVYPVRIYVNARLVDPSTSLVQAAASVEMEKSQEIARLLRGGAFPATLERIPVKHLGLSTYPLGVFGGYPYQQWEAEERGVKMPEANLDIR